ncbi:hypothetical protein B5X24_HaOG215628 [Helicoverpa armigera]|nr:hypothetical protein B5X24_HaOG215628 [Helicoverpa armigera]
MKLFSDETIKRLNTIGERNEVDEALALLIFTQDIIGQNVLDSNWSWKLTMRKQIMFVVSTVYVIIGIANYIRDAKDIALISEALYGMLVTSTVLIKYLLFMNKRKSLQRLYLTAKTEILEIIKTSGDKSKELLSKMRMIVRIYFGSIVVPVTTYFLAAVWNYIRGLRVNYSKGFTTLMPSRSPYHEIGLMLHSTIASVLGFTYYIMDVWFFILISFYCLTNDSLVNILKLERNEATEMEFMDQLHDALKTYYKNHVMLIEFLNTLSDMYKWLTIIPLVSVIITFCLMMLSMTVQTQWIFLTNAVAPVLQTFAYNWFGEQVKVKKSQLDMALLEFDGVSMRQKDKRNYLIIISYMNKEFGIKTALGDDLSLVTMTAILKASYQAYTLLRTTET